MEYTAIHQGYLCVPYAQIVSRFGKIQQIDDYDGWEIELNGLPIEIVTFDEQPEAETAFSIYSHHLDSLKLLAQEVSRQSISTFKPEIIKQLAA